MNRREFLQVLAVAGAGGMAFPGGDAQAARAAQQFYDVPRFGNVHLLHFTDCHAQLRPVHFREPSVNLGVAEWAGKPPHLVGRGLPARVRHPPPARLASRARRHLLVQRMKASRPGALLLDGGDTWQGSATALWTKGQDMVDAALQLGVDVMTPHWEMTLGAERVKQIVDNDFKGRVSFLAQNIKTNDFGDPVFDPT
jgi:sulfur-oxidizing protein SoxB